MSEVADKEKAPMRIIVDTASQVQQKLNDGWKFDPWLCPKGLPTIVTTDCEVHVLYWFLVAGTDEEILKMNPFVEVPAPELKLDQPVGYEAVLVEPGKTLKDYMPNANPDEWVILHKDHYSTKGVWHTRIKLGEVDEKPSPGSPS